MTSCTKLISVFYGTIKDPIVHFFGYNFLYQSFLLLQVCKSGLTKFDLACIILMGCGIVTLLTYGSPAYICVIVT